MAFLLEGLAGLGIASLLTVALAEWGKLRSKAERGFNWIGLGGVWFLFAGSFALATTLNGLAGPVFGWVGSLFEVVGWAFALVGTVFAAYELILEK